jgi:hypothetical protein
MLRCRLHQILISAGFYNGTKKAVMKVSNTSSENDIEVVTKPESAAFVKDS